MKSTFGAPSFARSGAGQAGLDSPMARPIFPGKVVPGLYSTNVPFESFPFFFLVTAQLFPFFNPNEIGSVDRRSRSKPPLN
jgi:hypothetical protein